MILSRPTGIAVIVFFTLLTNLFAILASLSYGPKFLILPVILVNYILPILLVFGAVGVWFKKQWGWWLLIVVTGVSIISKTAYTFTLPLNSYLPYLMHSAPGLIIGIVIFYYLFNKNIIIAFSIPLENRVKTLKQSIGISVSGGLMLLLVLTSVK